MWVFTLASQRPSTVASVTALCSNFRFFWIILSSFKTCFMTKLVGRISLLHVFCLTLLWIVLLYVNECERDNMFWASSLLYWKHTTCTVSKDWQAVLRHFPLPLFLGSDRRSRCQREGTAVVKNLHMWDRRRHSFGRAAWEMGSIQS